MSAQGVEFLEEWLDLNVGVPNQGVDLNKAHALAAKLAADATAAGISIEDMDLRGVSATEVILETMTMPVG